MLEDCNYLSLKENRKSIIKKNVEIINAKKCIIQEDSINENLNSNLQNNNMLNMLNKKFDIMFEFIKNKQFEKDNIKKSNDKYKFCMKQYKNILENQVKLELKLDKILCYFDYNNLNYNNINKLNLDHPNLNINNCKQ